MSSGELVVIGECGLCEAGPNMAGHEDKVAHWLRKPLALHLKGQTLSRMTAIYSHQYEHPQKLAPSVLPKV